MRGAEAPNSGGSRHLQPGGPPAWRQAGSSHLPHLMAASDMMQGYLLLECSINGHRSMGWTLPSPALPVATTYCASGGTPWHTSHRCQSPTQRPLHSTAAAMSGAGECGGMPHPAAHPSPCLPPCVLHHPCCPPDMHRRRPSTGAARLALSSRCSAACLLYQKKVGSQHDQEYEHNSGRGQPNRGESRQPGQSSCYPCPLRASAAGGWDRSRLPWPWQQDAIVNATVALRTYEKRLGEGKGSTAGASAQVPTWDEQEISGVALVYVS